ncbi:MAG TPA: glycosyltransferase family 4 protein [Bacillota bacterium]|nr:glycosyltransferase family 4 protein [Bacillota bacterium]
MKIVFFTNAYKPITSGVVRAISLFTRGLQEKGHQVYIFAPAYHDWTDEEPDIFRFPAVNLSRQVDFPIAIPYYPKLCEILHKIQPDIIHTHHPFVLGKIGIRQAQKLDIPTVYTFHTQYEQYAHYFPLPAEMVKKIARERIRSFARRVDRLTAPAESVVELLRGYGVDRPVTVLPNPIELGIFLNRDQGKVRECYGLEGKRMLLSVGRLGQEKNLGLMLRALVILTEDFPQLRLILVGSGPAGESLRREAHELGVTDRVIFTGRVADEELPSFFRAADLFIMTSLTETFGIVIMEAMAAGIPVVAVTGNGSKDLITPGLNGLLTSNDPQSLAASIRRLLMDEEQRTRMGRAAWQTAQRYSVATLTGELLALYESVICEHKRPS